MPDTLTPSPSTHGVDHYRPKGLFAELSCVYTNLFYCCNACNSRKRDYWPARAKERAEFIPNPCDHIMFQHLRFAGTVVKSHSEAGTKTIEFLQLNDEDVCECREFIITDLAVWLRCQAETDGLIRTLRARRANASNAEQVDIDRDLTDLEESLEKTKRQIARLTGG